MTIQSEEFFGHGEPQEDQVASRDHAHAADIALERRPKLARAIEAFSAVAFDHGVCDVEAGIRAALKAIRSLNGDFMDAALRELDKPSFYVSRGYIGATDVVTSHHAIIDHILGEQA